MTFGLKFGPDHHSWPVTVCRHLGEVPPPSETPLCRGSGPPLPDGPAVARECRPPVPMTPGRMTPALRPGVFSCPEDRSGTGGSARRLGVLRPKCSDPLFHIVGIPQTNVGRLLPRSGEGRSMGELTRPLGGDAKAPGDVARRPQFPAHGRILVPRRTRPVCLGLANPKRCRIAVRSGVASPLRTFGHRCPTDAQEAVNHDHYPPRARRSRPRPRDPVRRRLHGRSPRRSNHP